jgi:hypothetical protein
MRQEQIANELAKQRANALESTAVMGQELLHEWQTQVGRAGMEWIGVG